MMLKAILNAHPIDATSHVKKIKSEKQSYYTSRDGEKTFTYENLKFKEKKKDEPVKLHTRIDAETSNRMHREFDYWRRRSAVFITSHTLS